MQSNTLFKLLHTPGGINKQKKIFMSTIGIERMNVTKKEKGPKRVTVTGKYVRRHDY